MINELCVTELKMLLTRIAIEGYTTVEQITGDIHNRIDELESKDDDNIKR